MNAGLFDPASVTGTWSYPNRLLVGPGRIRDLPELCRESGYRRPLLVTDRGLAELPMVGETESALRRAGVAVATFSGVGGNPTYAQVQDGLAAYRAGGCDAVIALGGGSALDAGKAIAFMSGQTAPIWDFEDIGDRWRRARSDGIAPAIAIPTTAGTGSEVGRAAVISDEAAGRKVIVFHPRMLPVAAILDPELTVGLPPAITAATGIDAFVHCFEAWCAPGFHPLADGMALQGMRQVAEALPRACADGRDIEARTMMLVAASMGALAFQKGLGAVHALAHAVGAVHHTHHGLTNAVILPTVMRFNRSAIAVRMKPVAQAVGIDAGGFDAVLDWVLRLRALLGIPTSLAALGVDDSRADRVAELAAADPSAAGNPVPVDAPALRRLFLEALEAP